MNELAAKTVNALGDKGLTVSFAESLTGGLISSTIVGVPGASNVFKGSIVSYTNSVKIDVLGVKPEIINAHTEVSAQCAEEMARGAMRVMDTDIALSVTGIAGPAGDLPGKPVGTVFMGIAYGDEVTSKRFAFEGDRLAIRELTCKACLETILELLGA